MFLSKTAGGSVGLVVSQWSSAATYRAGMVQQTITCSFYKNTVWA